MEISCEEKNKMNSNYKSLKELMLNRQSAQTRTQEYTPTQTPSVAKQDIQVNININIVIII